MNPFKQQHELYTTAAQAANALPDVQQALALYYEVIKIQSEIVADLNAKQQRYGQQIDSMISEALELRRQAKALNAEAKTLEARAGELQRVDLQFRLFERSIMEVS